MQTYLTTINELLMQWYAIIMANPVYKTIFIAACVAAVIWFLMLVSYQVKVVRLRRQLRKADLAYEAERKLLNAELDTVKEQLQQTAVELDAKNVQVTQLETDRLSAQALLERATGLEQKAKQLVADLQTDFFLPALSAAQASDLSYALNHAMQNIADRLKIAQQQNLEVSQLRQQEQAALADKDKHIADLQSQIAVYAAQIQTLENDFKAQKSNWQQEQAQLHQEIQLAQTNQDTLRKATQLEQTRLQPAASVENFSAAVASTDATTQDQPEMSTTAAVAESVFESVKHAVVPLEEAMDTVVANVSEVAADVEAATETSIAKAGNQFSKFLGSMKGFGSAKKSVLEESAVVAEEVVEEIQAQASHAVEAVEELIAEAQESSQVSRFFGSLKNLGSGKQSAVEEVAAEAESQAAVDVVASASAEASGAISKLKGMMNFKKAPAAAKAESEVVAEPEALLDSMVEKLEASNINKLMPKKLKDIYHKIMSV